MMAFLWLFSGKDRKDEIPDSNPELEKEWRKMAWGDRDEMLNALCKFKPDSKLSHLNILLYGPAGAGKSTFINTAQSIMRGRKCCTALGSSVQTEGTLGETFTQKYKHHNLKDKDGVLRPFLISDIMGVERDESRGVRNDDVHTILKGNIKEGYNFNPNTPITEGDTYYIKKPSLSDKVHCLVFVLSAESIALISDDVYSKMREIRKRARDLDIPQVVMMTKVDSACPLVKKDIKNIYTSRKIKQKMEESHQKIGVPVDCIFPVKNCSEELDTNTETDILILTALTHIVNFANDYVENYPEEKESL